MENFQEISKTRAAEFFTKILNGKKVYVYDRHDDFDSIFIDESGFRCYEHEFEHYFDEDFTGTQERKWYTQWRFTDFPDYYSCCSEQESIEDYHVEIDKIVEGETVNSETKRTTGPVVCFYPHLQAVASHHGYDLSIHKGVIALSESVLSVAEEIQITYDLAC